MYDVSPQAWLGTAIYFHFNNSVSSVHMISRKVSWLAEGDIAESAWCSSETKDEKTPTVSENLHNQNGIDALRPASTEEPYPEFGDFSSKNCGVLWQLSREFKTQAD